MAIQDLSAYQMIEERPLKDIDSTGYLLKHKKSGARVVYIGNKDDNKVFYIGFRTPPKDSTGVPHILEHSVLCGSREFPAKDPFVELAKGSLNTFLNAMTYPDKTVYPVASCNDKDFQNLMHVYMDAVMHPRIYEEEKIFRQEGWHYELENEDEDIVYNGVVYNEMKGAFSSPESVLDREILNSLCPDTAYGKESGGNPENIPELTYEGFLDFHRSYYHPANSYIYLYGDMDIEERLNWLDEAYLSKYDKIDLDSAPGEQKPFERKAEVVKSFSITEGEEEKDNAYLSFNKVIDTSLNKELYLGFEALEYALLTAPGAPVKQALLDAGIGKDIIGGYDNGSYYPIFSIIAKNSNIEDKERFVETIETILQKLITEGINRKSLQAGINAMEFRFKEADYGPYPKGLMYGLRMFDSWLYDEEKPFIHLEVDETFRFLKEKLETDYYEKLVEKYLLKNTHASLVTIVPEKGLTAKKEQKTAEILKAYKESLTKEELTALVEETKALKRYQEEPSPKEILEKIPLLSRSEIRREIEKIVNEEKIVHGYKALFHDVSTNGIAYIRLLFSLKQVPEELLPYVGVLKSVLGYMDTANYTYSELANEINCNTGGIFTGTLFIPHKNDADRFQCFYSVHCKTLYDKIGFSMEMAAEIIGSTSFKDEKRLHEILSQAKSRLHMAMNSSGHQTAANRAKSYFSPIGRMQDKIGGMDYYFFIKDLEEHFEEKKGELIEKLEELLTIIFRKDNLFLDCTARPEGFEAFQDAFPAFHKALREESASKEAERPAPVKKNEGFKTPAMVQYVACAGNYVKKGLPYTGKLHVLRVILGMDYFWNNVRVKGGAYGCMNSMMRNGDSYFVSYRDPNLEKTLDVFQKASDYVKEFHADEREMTKYILGTFSNLDTPLNPDDKGFRSLNLYLQGITAEELQKERDEILAVSEEDIRQLAPYMEAIYGAGNICVIGSEEKIKEQQSLFMELREL